jgi:PAS domain S-box-containing protein
MKGLHAIARSFVSEGHLPTALDLVVSTALTITGTDRATVELLDEAGELKLAAYRGLSRRHVERFARRQTSAVEGWRDLARGRRVVVADLEKRNALLVPLRDREGKMLGVLSTHQRASRRPDRRASELLGLLAVQCSEVLERARWAEACVLENARARLAERHESEARFKTTVENIPINLVVFDRKEYRVLYLNPTLAAMCAGFCGISAEALLGKPAETLWPESIWTPLRANAERAIATRQRQSYELEVTLPGRPRVVRQWSVVPIAGPDGDISEILAMSTDITELRRLVDELREADRSKSEFIAVLSHELRNPLSAIQSSLYVLERTARHNDTTKASRGIMERQIGRLVRIVDDLLDVARITQNKIRLKREHLELNQLVGQTVADNRHLELSGVTLEARLAGTPLFVNADGARIAQVVTNLLSNAVKFTPSGGKTVVWVADDRPNGRAVIRVADNGAGIEPALLERLFQPFSQADRTRDLSRGGLGLGLALVKGLVELHGGEVSAKSEGRGKGTEITVRLPLAGTDGDLASPAPREEITLGSRRVLIIEDEQDVADGLRQLLALDRHEVLVARSGAEGIAAALAFRPHVVFCDIGLPGMNGYEVAGRLRATEELRTTLLVALTGYAQGENIEQAHAAGFHEHVAKPPGADRIKRILASVWQPTNTTSRA